MPNAFDSLKANMFKDVTSVMGFEARWLSSVTGLVTIAAHGVTFKKPSLKEKQLLEYDDAFWEPTNRIMEYFESDFPGLFDLANRPDLGVQKIQVDNEYYVAGEARRMFDGDLVYVQLFPDEDV